MFFFQSHLLIYIRKTAIQVFSGSKSETLELPPAIVQNLEIVSKEAYLELINSFFSKYKKANATILLSSEVVFQKALPLEEEDKLNPKIQEFIDKVPFDNEHLVKKEVFGKTTATIFTTNKSFFQILVDNLREKGWKIESVVPLNPFKFKLNLTDDSIDPSLAKKILSEKEIINESNLLTGSYKEASEAPEPKSFPLGLFILFGILIIALISLILAVYLGYIKNPLSPFLSSEEPQKQEVIEEKEATSSAEEATESAGEEEASPSATSKEELSLQVLNGSGVAGQASAVKAALEGIGFSNIELGNSEEVGNTETLISFKEEVSKKIVDEIKAELEKTFSEVNSKEITEGEYDIIITTGSSNEATPESSPEN